MSLFRVFVDGDLFYHPGLSKLAITQAQVKEDAENIDSLTLSAPFNHPYLEKVKPMASTIVCKKDEQVVFEGRALDDGSDFYNTHTWTCESALAYLKDSLQPPYDYQGTIKGLLELFVENHNAKVEEKKRFTVGNVTVMDSNDYIHYSNSEHSVTLEAIKEKLIKTYGGFLCIRYTDNGKVLDYLSDFKTYSVQTVEFGKNLLDVKITKDHTERVTALIPYTLTYSFGSATGTIATKTTSTSVSWTPALSLANQIPNALTGTCTITCETYNGSTKIGSKTCTLTLTVPSSVKPTITSLTATRVNGDVPSAWGIYVQTKSKVTLTVNGAAGSYGSTISSYSITGGGFSSTSSSFTTGFLNTSGTITFTATVTDSRGRVSSATTVSIAVQAYSPPSFTNYLSQRCTSGGTVSDEGTYVKGLVSFSYSSCSSKNTVTGSIQYKKSSATSWTSAGVAFSLGTAVVFGGGAISTETSYDIKYTLTDAFGSVSIQDIVSTASVVMDFKAGGKGVAVGKVSETDNMFEVSEDWDVKVYGKLLKDYIQQFSSAIYPVGSIYMSVNSTNPSTYFGGTWVAWGSGRVPVGINTSDTNFSTVEKTGGASTVTLTTSQMPSHTHTFTGSSATTSSNGAHTHTLNLNKTAWSGSSGSRVVVDSTDYTALTNNKTSSNGAHTHTLTAKGSNANTGGGGSHTNLQPYIVCYMWKRTA